MIQYNAVLDLPYSSETFPQDKLKKILPAIFGVTVPTSKCYRGYTDSGGFYYPKEPSFEQPYEVEVGCSCCITADRDFLLKNYLLRDPDLEKFTYLLCDDRAFVIDVVRHVGRTILVGNIPYEHLGRLQKLRLQCLYQFFEASVFNSCIFWYKYINKYIKGRYRIKVVPIVSFTWHLIGIFVLAFLSSSRQRNVQLVLVVVLKYYIRTV